MCNFVIWMSTLIFVPEGGYWITLRPSVCTPWIDLRVSGHILMIGSIHLSVCWFIPMIVCLDQTMTITSLWYLSVYQWVHGYVGSHVNIVVDWLLIIRFETPRPKWIQPHEKLWFAYYTSENISSHDYCNLYVRWCGCKENWNPFYCDQVAIMVD